jgi:hypothetical protein
MAAVARRLLLRPGVGERLLTSKLQILNGTGTRRPSAALSMLTGRIADHLSLVDNDEPVRLVSPSLGDDEPVRLIPQALSLAIPVTTRHYAARTVYLSERHLHDIDRIIQAWQQVEPRRLTRSAVLRRAIEHLRVAVEADPAKSMLEND